MNVISFSPIQNPVSVEPRSRRRRWFAGHMAALILGLLSVSDGWVTAQTVPLGAAEDFAVLGGSAVTNTGATIIAGNVGVSPGSSVTGFPPGVLVNGTIHINDALAIQAHADAFIAYNQVAGETFTTNLTGQDLGGLTLTPGIYRFDAAAQLTGILNLDTLGDPDAPFHFQIGSALTTASNSTVTLLNGGSNNIFWQVGSSATLGTGSLFGGNILALTSITLNTGANLDGRALAINGAVTLDNNNIEMPTLAPGSFWTGNVNNLWSGANWSPTATGIGSSTLAPIADVVFSATGIPPQNQNTILDVDTTISSLTINDPAAVTISGANLLTIVGTGSAAGITVNSGAGLATINSNLNLSGPTQAVTVNNAEGLVINGVIAGTEGVIKAGSGAITLTAANTYTGLTTVGAGTLVVNGSIAGNTLVSGGTLRGIGAIGGNVVNQAFVSPGLGGAPGTLTIGGNYSQSPEGILNIRIASTSDFDRLIITGEAVLNGALKLSYLDGYDGEVGDRFPILTAEGGVTGRFSSFDDSNVTGTLLGMKLVYTDRGVFLEFSQGSFADLADNFELTQNERRVARALDKLAANNPDDELIQELNSLQLSEVPGALSLLSPEDFASIFSAGLAISQVQVGNIERRLTEVRRGNSGFSDAGFAVSDSRGAQNYDGKNVKQLEGKTIFNVEGKSTREVQPASVEQDPRWGFFIAGTGEFGDLEITNTARGSNFTTGGVTVGADYRVNNHLVVGAAIGYANTSSDISQGGDVDFNSGKASVYATVYDQGFYLNAVVGAGYGSIDTNRRTVGGFARGQTEATDFNALLGTGYDFHLGAFTVGPVASLQYTTFGIDSFSENGAVGALRFDSQNQESLESAVGLRASYTKKLGRVIVTPEIRAQWQHEYLDNASSIDASFSSGSAFTVHGPEIGRDALLLDIGASAQLTSRSAIFLFYTGELFRENYTVHSINGGVRMAF